MDSNKQPFLDKVEATISKYAMLSNGDRVLIGLSGGPDSVCLLSVLHKLKEEFGLKLHALYVDHGLRPQEVPGEIAFCRKLCEGLSVPLVVRSVDVKTYAKEQGMNRQEAARELRYRAFDEVSADIKADRLALGHTADDQVETFFMRFLRGSGARGLAGIPPVRARIIRPLIEVERSHIERFLDGERINYLVDASNLKDDYLRNKIRLLMIPEMRKINPRITEAVTRTTDILREEEKYFELIVTGTLMKLISRKTDLRIELFLTPLESMEKVILRRVLRRAVGETRGLRGMELVHIDDVLGLIKKGRHGDRLYLPKGVRVIKNYATLVITSEVPPKLESISLGVPGEVVLKNINTVIRAEVDDKGENCGDGRTAAVFDADKTGSSLLVRPREKGDFFYPTGFGRKKKLQDYFVDLKVPRDERDAIPIILSGGDILWIAGFRGDERFKVTEGTRRFLRLEFKRGLP